MTTMLHLLPLLTVVALLAARRASLLRAGLIGCALTIPMVAQVFGLRPELPRFLLHQAALGGWIAWQAVAVILAGLAFCTALRAAQPGLFATSQKTPGALSYHRLYAVCFLVGPLAESATGFGIGAVIAASLLMRMGASGVGAAVFALYSQILVPWGALAVGTVTGAELIRVPGGELGVRSALLTLPLLCGYLMFFWHLAGWHGLRPTIRQRLDDVLWTALLGGTLYAANRVLAVETAGVAATAALLVLRYLRDEAPSRAELGTTSRSIAPLLLLIASLLLTRMVAPLRHALRGALVVAPWPELPAFPILYHVSTWLLLVAIATAALAGQPVRWGTLGRQVWTAGRVPAAVTLVFMVMAQWMMAAGLPSELAQAWSGVAGRAALLAAPLFGALGGLLTGSGVAANGLFMPLQAALAVRTGTDILWVAALQNTTSSAFTMFSPIRVALICAVVGITDGGGEVYRKAAPLGLMVILAMMVAAALQ